MEVEVRLFGALADRAGARSVTVTVPDGATVGEVVAAVGARHSEIAEAAGRVSVAVDLEVVGAEQPVPAGAEVALLPPVAGGCGAR